MIQQKLSLFTQKLDLGTHEIKIDELMKVAELVCS